MHAIEEDQRAVVIESGNKRADALTESRGSVVAYETNVGRAELESPNEIECRRDERSHALFTRGSPQRDQLGQRLFSHGSLLVEALNRENDAVQTESAGSAPGQRR